MNEPIAWIRQGEYGKPIIVQNPLHQFSYQAESAKWDDIPLYTHPAKELNEAIKIIKDFQSDDVPPCKAYEDTYADGWMDACNEILWAIEEQAQEK